MTAEYPLDVLIYATGFSGWRLQRSIWLGREGQLCATSGGKSTKTFLGLHGKGFPNLFLISGPQIGGGSFNFTNAIEEHGDYVVWLLETMRDQGNEVVDVEAEHEDAAKHCRDADQLTRPLRDCITYYNGHGEAEPGSLAYYGGGTWHKYRIRAQGP